MSDVAITNKKTGKVVWQGGAKSCAIDYKKRTLTAGGKTYTFDEATVGSVPVDTKWMKKPVPKKLEKK